MSTSQSASHEMGSEPAYMTGAQSLIASLEASDVDVVFGIPGGAILPAYDPMMDSTKVRHILVRHEQAPGMLLKGMQVQPVGWECAWRQVVQAQPTWSPRSLTPTWIRSPWSQSLARSPVRQSALMRSKKLISGASRCRSPNIVFSSLTLRRFLRR